MCLEFKLHSYIRLDGMAFREGDKSVSAFDLLQLLQKLCRIDHVDSNMNSFFGKVNFLLQLFEYSNVVISSVE